MVEKLPYKIRQLQKEDLGRGFFETLNNMSPVGNLNVERANQIYDRITENPDNYVFVAELDGQIVGTVTLYVKPKFIREGRYVGRIADVATRDNYEGKGIGRELILAAVEEAKKRGCRKVTLSSRKEAVEFYKKLGFVEWEVEMRMNFEE